jgi:hypothetical protein
MGSSYGLADGSSEATGNKPEIIIRNNSIVICANLRDLRGNGFLFPADFSDLRRSENCVNI